MWGATKDIVIVLGNGFSIDLIHKINKNRSINLSNLFANGDRVPWPGDGTPGFLSYNHCPELWTLGARPNMDSESASKLIDDIITCANVSASSEHPAIHSDSSNVYIKAYHELVSYLKYLFVYYNGQVSDKELKELVDDKWGWSELISNLNNNLQINSITFVTYNYDIFLERILHIMQVPFQMVGFDNVDEKIRVIKPHGSISFRSHKTLPHEIYSIKYNRDSLGGTIDDIEVDEMVNCESVSSINTMIPPAGESGRYNLSWSNTLRDEALVSVKNLVDADDIIFGGLSYCNVDRQEIDKILINLNNEVNVKNVNPSTNNTFGAVISSIFRHYTHYLSSDILGGLYK